MSQVILTDEFLKHHGVKGMHWYQRRYQNPDGTLTEAGKRRYARHQAKLDTKINNAVTTGDKKKLSKLQDKMSPEQYEENYKRTVANGIQNAIMDRSKHELRKYKEDLDPRTYKQTKKRIDFKAAVDEGDNKTIRKLSSQVKPEDIAEATQFINARLSLKESELKRIRQDTELMAQVDAITNKINTGAKFLGSVANAAKNTNAILKEYDEFTKRGSKSESDKLSSEVISKLKEDLPNMSNDELRETLKVLNSGGGGSKKKDDKAKHSDFDPEEFLEHHGVLGMKWGVRRYQRKNGSLTPEGLARYRSVRKDIRTEAGKLKALETNMRNKADVAAPAELKRKKAEEFYEQTLRKSSKRSIFDSRAKREARAKDLRIAEYNLEDATKAAERSRKNFDKSQKIYDMQLEKLQSKIKSAKKDYGEFVNELVLSDVKLGETYSDKTNSDAMLWTKKMVNNYGMIKMADISKTVMEMEKLLDAKIAG